MTHKKPINMSTSSKNIYNPVVTRYIPARYHSVIILKVLMKKTKVIKGIRCNNSIKLLSIKKMVFSKFLKLLNTAGVYFFFIL